jgi:protein-S-isoprenylcysteine O-methyltransferase Ste14
LVKTPAVDGDTRYRITVVVVIVLMAIVGPYHRFRAARVGGALTGPREPLAIRVPLKLCGLAGMVLIVCWLARPSLVAWAGMPLPAGLRWAGAGLAFAAVPMLAWTFRSLGHNLTDTSATRDNSYLVTAGPYRYVRHPFYVTIATSFAGMSLLTALWAVALLMFVVLVLLALRTPLEERKLVERFGDAYVAYMSRTPRYVPRLTGAPVTKPPA